MKRISAVQTADAAGVLVKLLFPTWENLPLDPFAQFSEFTVEGGSGVLPHAHSGLESVTYLLSGRLRHWDSLGNDRAVGPGGVQHFVAGRGIEHSELPATETACHGLQLWVNLPAKLKSTRPRYEAVMAHQIPQSHRDGATIRTVVGGASPLKLRSSVFFQHVQLLGGGTWKHSMRAGHTGFLYLLRGDLAVDELVLRQGEGLLLFEGQRLSARAVPEAHFVCLTGKPLGQPIAVSGDAVA
jgi:redox-sensitive bicupin YhaK (pirin superfamily)